MHHFFSTLTAVIAFAATTSAAAVDLGNTTSEVLDLESVGVQVTNLDERAENAGSGTVCCPTKSNCITWHGTTSGGLHWCYGYWAGNKLFSQKAANVAKCMTDLHHRQNDKCISVKGSHCKQDTAVNAMTEGVPFKHEKLTVKDSRAIQAAIQAAANRPLKFDAKSDVSGSLGYVSFAHVADNGGILGNVKLYFDANAHPC